MVDDELDGHARVDRCRVRPEGFHGVSHCGQVDDGGHAGEVLHEDAGGNEGDLSCAGRPRCPVGKGLDVGLGHRGAVLVAEEVLEEDLHGEGKAVNVGDRVESVEPEDLE